MFTSTFTFEAKTFDEDFHRLNDAIAEQARAIPGFLGEEDWTNNATGLHSEVYYWDTMESLQQLVSMALHRDAKRQHERWIGRYKIVIAEVVATYGTPDLALEHQPSS